MHNWTRSFAIVAFALALPLPAVADKLDDIKARGYLLVGVTESSPPFSFRGADKNIVGYDVDLANCVAENLGVSTRKIPIINAERIPALQQDRVDLVAVGMTRSRDAPTTSTSALLISTRLTKYWCGSPAALCT